MSKSFTYLGLGQLICTGVAMSIKKMYVALQWVLVKAMKYVAEMVIFSFC